MPGTAFAATTCFAPELRPGAPIGCTPYKVFEETCGTCGDGACSGGETCSRCPSDCGPYSRCITPARRKVMALTFDDGPTVRTGLVLDVLKQYNAKATFFNIGIQATTLNMTHATHFTKRLLREGHTLGGHTYVHDEL
eukprot:gene8627-17987_t